MVRLTPTRSTAVVLLVPAVIVAALLITANSHSRPIAAVPIATSTGRATTGVSPSPTAWPYPPLPTPTQRPCVLPPSLPVPERPIATPAVAADGVSILFSSYLYGPGRNGSPAVLDDPGTNWAVGLWYAPEGTAALRLLAAPRDGMVLPLALSPSGALAAVWWLPDRRGTGDPACDGGIYLLSTTSGASHLVVSGDWTETSEPGEPANQEIGVPWMDPRTGQSGPRTYRLPEAAFSADDRFVTIVDGALTSIYPVDATAAVFVHAGTCASRAWAPVGATFVVGCEHMTTAWIFDANEPSVRRLALPWLGTQARATGWGDTAASAIGLTRDSRVRLAGFFGFATECSGTTPCPRPAYTIVTVDSATGKAVVQSAKVDFLVEPELGISPRFSANAGWLYVQGEPTLAGPETRTLTVATGKLAPAMRLETFAGAALDGEILFGSQRDVERRTQVLIALDAAGTTRSIGTIGWATGASGLSPAIDVFGLQVIAPAP